MLIKILSTLSVLGIVCSLSIIILWQSTKNDLESLQSKHTALEKDYKEIKESKKNLEDSKKSTEIIVANQIKDLMALEKSKQSLLDQLNNLPKKSCPKIVKTPKGSCEVTNETEYVDIHAPYDDNYLGVFKQLPKRGSNTSR